MSISYPFVLMNWHGNFLNFDLNTNMYEFYTSFRNASVINNAEDINMLKEILVSHMASGTYLALPVNVGYMGKAIAINPSQLPKYFDVKG